MCLLDSLLVIANQVVVHNYFSKSDRLLGRWPSLDISQRGKAATKISFKKR
jgi:hypothetical protein